MIISSAGQQMSAPAYTVTLTLPEISYPRSELIIISTLTPADSAPITDDYPLSSQYFVTFHGLNAGVEYSYVIRIVLQRSNSINVSIPLTGSFTISKNCITQSFDYRNIHNYGIVDFTILLPSNNFEQMFKLDGPLTLVLLIHSSLACTNLIINMPYNNYNTT